MAYAASRWRSILALRLVSRDTGRAMSRGNVEVVRRLIPKPDVDLVPLFRDEETFARLAEAISPFFTDDFKSVVCFPAASRTEVGSEGLRKNWLDWLEPWATYRTTIEELIDLGERVVVLVRNHGRRDDMEIEVDLIGAVIVTFRGGKVARWEDWVDRAQALEAVGLRE
jgi:ketosteroid isomerase-like protein